MADGDVGDKQFSSVRIQLSDFEFRASRLGVKDSGFTFRVLHFGIPVSGWGQTATLETSGRGRTCANASLARCDWCVRGYHPVYEPSDFRANMAQVRQPKLDRGLGFQTRSWRWLCFERAGLPSKLQIPIQVTSPPRCRANMAHIHCASSVWG